MRLRPFLFLALLAATSFGTAEAAITFDVFFRTSGFDGFDSTLPVVPDQTFDGTIVLRETVTDGTPSLLSASNLNAAGVRIDVSGSNGRISNLATETEGGIAPNNNDTTLTFAAFGGGFGQPGKAPVEVGSGINEITLGSLTLTSPTAGQTTYSLADVNPNSTGDFTTFAGELDGGEFNYRSLTLSTITAIPEPSSALALMGVSAVVVMRRRRRR